MRSNSASERNEKRDEIKIEGRFILGGKLKLHLDPNIIAYCIYSGTRLLRPLLNYQKSGKVELQVRLFTLCLALLCFAIFFLEMV